MPAALLARVAALEHENRELKKKLVKLPTLEDHQQEADTARAKSGAASDQRSDASAPDKPSDFFIVLKCPPRYKKQEPPYSFKKDGFLFPHLVQKDKTGEKQYACENRRQVHISCELRHDCASRVVTEMDLPCATPIKFKLELVYSHDTSVVVEKSAFKNKPACLLEPPESQIQVCEMQEGRLSWRFKLNFLSRMASSLGKSFSFRVTCVNPELSHLDLSCLSPAFVSISRDINQRKEADKAKKSAKASS